MEGSAGGMGTGFTEIDSHSAASAHQQGRGQSRPGCVGFGYGTQLRFQVRGTQSPLRQATDSALRCGLCKRTLGRQWG